jgi:hypothetical protein
LSLKSPKVKVSQKLKTVELSKKSSKTEYMYPQFCISFATVFRLETPPSNMTTKLQCFLSEGRGMGEQVGGLEEQLVT